MTQTYPISMSASTISALADLIDNQLDFLYDMVRDQGLEGDDFETYMVQLLRLEAAQSVLYDQVDSLLAALLPDLKGPNLGKDLRDKIDDIQRLTAAKFNLRPRERDLFES